MTKTIFKFTKTFILSQYRLLIIFIYFFTLNYHPFARAEYKGHGVESLSPETLKKFAPPPLEPSKINYLKKMFDISAPGSSLLSPDKKTLYFSWKVTGTFQIWKLDSSKGFPEQLTSGSDEVLINDISPNGEFLIISKDINGEENPGLFRLNVKSKQIEELYRKKNVKSRFGFISNDSKWLYFSANEKKQDSNSIFRLNLETKEIASLFDGEGLWLIADYKNNGSLILLVKYNGSKQNEFYIYNSDNNAITPLLGQNEREEYSVKFSSKENEYFVLSNKSSDFKRLYLYKNEKMTLLSPPNLNHEITDFIIDPTRSRITYTINRNGYFDISVINAKTYAAIPTPTFPISNSAPIDQIIQGYTTLDGTISQFSIITSQSPRISFSYNWKTKKIKEWVTHSSPEVDLSKFAISELLHYETRDGVKIPMFVRFPKECRPQFPERKKCNIIVHFHGGPESQSLPGFSVFDQAFVDEQFIFVEPNIRGSDGYGRTWIEMDDGRKRESVIADIEDAALWIKQNWKHADGSTPKVGVMGGSYGGYATLLAMTRFAGSYDAGVSIVGMSNLISFLNNTAPYRRALRISEYGDPVKDAEILKKLSPINYINKIKAPLLIIQGANDPRVPAGEAIQIHESLTKRNLPSKLILFSDEGHGSLKKENQVLELGHTLEFFKKHLNDTHL